MKKKYTKPMVETEDFIPNEYVSNCIKTYTVTCNLDFGYNEEGSTDLGMPTNTQANAFCVIKDVNKNGQYDSGVDGAFNTTDAWYASELSVCGDSVTFTKIGEDENGITLKPDQYLAFPAYASSGELQTIYYDEAEVVLWFKSGCFSMGTFADHTNTVNVS